MGKACGIKSRKQKTKKTVNGAACSGYSIISPTADVGTTMIEKISAAKIDRLRAILSLLIKLKTQVTDLARHFSKTSVQEHYQKMMTI